MCIILLPVLAYFKISFVASIIHLSNIGSEILHNFGIYLAETGEKKNSNYIITNNKKRVQKAIGL